MRKTKILKLTIFTTAVLGAGFFLNAKEAQAACESGVCYADDSNFSDEDCSCLIDSPCSLTKALSCMEVSDDLTLLAGTYTQPITVPVPGTIVDPVIISGTLDGHGNLLSMLDISTEIVGGWIDASHDPGMNGQPVWKQVLPANAYTMSFVDTANGNKPYSIPRLCQGDPEKTTYCVDWRNALNKPAEARYNSSTNYCPRSNWVVCDDPARGCTGQKKWCGGDEYNPLFWDGIDAMFTSDINGVTYIRFRDGDNPNNYTLRWTPQTQVIKILNLSNVTVENFEIRASQWGIYVVGACSNIVINNNKIYNGRKKIDTPNDTSDRVTFSNNELFQQAYSDYVGDYSWGAHGCVYEEAGDCTRSYQVYDHMYYFYKYYCGSSDSTNESNGIYARGNNHLAINNKIHSLAGGISFAGNNFEIANNEIYDTFSIGIYLEGGYFQNSSIHDNLIHNNNINVRLGDVERGGGPLYAYGNKFWLPPHAGSHIYYHMYTQAAYNPPITLSFPDIWWYHNTFSGGRSSYGLSTTCYYNWGHNDCTKNVRYINNIFSAQKVESEWTTWAYGECVNNWFSGGLMNTLACQDSSNFYNGTAPMWDTTALHNFQVPDGSLAVSVRNAGVDISQPSYQLPGFLAGYGGEDGKPDMGALQFGESLVSPADVDGSGSVNIKDIQACIKVITGSNMTYQNQCNILADPPGTTNIKDIQVIIRKIINP